MYLETDTAVDIGEIRQAHILGFRNEMAKEVCTPTRDLPLLLYWGQVGISIAIGAST
jgi:hypothetical protein